MMPHPMLAALPYEDWKDTLTTVHLMAQVVGKLRLGHVPHRSHWWNATLQLTPRGLTTGRMRSNDSFFEIAFDFVDHELVVSCLHAHQPRAFALEGGMTVAEFYDNLFRALREVGVETAVWEQPYGMGVETRFGDDREHASYDRVMVRRWFEATLWSADVFDEFGSSYAAKQSPAHLFWHSFDLAMARFSGRLAPERIEANVVEREAYSHEVISSGFWAGDERTPAASYYTYTAPEPAALTQQPLQPQGVAQWAPSGTGHLGVLSYDAVREAADPRATLLDFLQSGFDAGTRAAGWDTSALLRSIAVAPPRDDRRARYSSIASST